LFNFSPSADDLRGCTQDAIDIFEASRNAVKDVKATEGICFYAPGKAANCGGVAVSGLEMAQNSQRLKWTPAEVDAKLKDIMVTCCEYPHLSCFDVALTGRRQDLLGDRSQVRRRWRDPLARRGRKHCGVHQGRRCHA
jgi:hypothetical protein